MRRTLLYLLSSQECFDFGHDMKSFILEFKRGTVIKPIVVNYSSWDENALGVPRVIANLSRVLSETRPIIFVVPDRHALSPESGLLMILEASKAQILSSSEASRAGLSEYIELLPHQFQEAQFCKTSILICHDFHCYDVPWKYKNPTRLQQIFDNNVNSASVVVTHFPSVHARLNNSSRYKIPHLYFTASPLLTGMEMEKELTETRSTPAELYQEGFEFLLFPSQFQSHKNHAALLEGLRRLRNQGQPIRLAFPGTNHDSRMAEIIQDLTRDFGLESEVYFLGRITDGELLDLYKNCSGVIVPSLAEGGAYVALEAIHLGVPVAVNRLVSAEMHLGMFGAEAIWFDSLNSDEIVSAMTKLIGLDRNGEVDKNSAARSKINAMSWHEVANQWGRILGWLEGDLSRPEQSIGRDYAHHSLD